jgi:hypothetical protein
MSPFPYDLLLVFPQHSVLSPQHLFICHYCSLLRPYTQGLHMFRHNYRQWPGPFQFFSNIFKVLHNSLPLCSWFFSNFNLSIRFVIYLLAVNILLIIQYSAFILGDYGFVPRI